MTNKQKLINIAQKLYVDEYKHPIIFTPTQQDIYFIIVNPTYNHIGILCPTQYGKSWTIALALLTIAMGQPLKIKIISTSQVKTRIIMDYVIGHVFDNPMLLSQLIYDGGKLEQLKQQRNKDHLTFRNGADVRILTADARNQRNVGATVLGEGADIVFLDESPLINNDLYDMIYRMIGGRKNGRIIETGNAIRRNHYHKLMSRDNAGRFHKIIIDYTVGLKEGRYTPEFIEEARRIMSSKSFKMLYECVFPDDNEMDEKGYMDLFTYSEIERGIESGILPKDDDMVEQLKVIRYKHNSSGKIQIEPKLDLIARGVESPDIADALSLCFYKHYSDTDKVMGIDIGAGGCETVYALRYGKQLKIYSRDLIKDTMITVGKIKGIIETEQLDHSKVNIDKGGLGAGPCDRLHEQEIMINAVQNQEQPDEIKYKWNDRGERVKQVEFANKRAEMYWRLHDFVCTGDVKPDLSTEPGIS